MTAGTASLSLPPAQMSGPQPVLSCLLPGRATSFPIALVYLLLILVGQNYMKTRKGFHLQWPLILWSFCLAVFR